MRVDRTITFWVLTSVSGVCAVWLVTFVGLIVGGLLEGAIGSTTVFWEASFLVPVIYGSPSGAIVAGLGGACKKWMWAIYVGFGTHLVYFFLVSSTYYYSAVAPYSSAKGVFWWIFLVGLMGGTAAGGLGGALGHFRAISQRNNETEKA